MEITSEYKIAPHWPRPRPMFAWTEPVVMVEIAPDPQHRDACFMTPETRETIISNVPVLSNASTNTESSVCAHRGMRHTEGGWPNNVDISEREGRAKHCKRVEREEGYLAACQALIKTTKPFLRLGSAIDIFEVYSRFNSDMKSGPSNLRAPADQAPPASPDPPAAQETERAACPSSSDRPMCVTMKFAAPQLHLQVTQLSFTCGSDADHVAVGYVRAGTEGYTPLGGEDVTTMAGAVWSLSSCVAPAYVLHSKYGGCTAIACCPKDPFQIVGGSSTGIVQVWDLRQLGHGGESSLPISSSKRLESHQDAVTEARYVMSKGVDVMTCSIDGRVLFWDLRSLSEPLHEETLELLVKQRGASSAAGDDHADDFDDECIFGEAQEDPAARATYTACYLDYDPMVGGVQQYLVGTSEGVVLACTRRSKSRGDRILHRYQASLSSVFAAQRSAALPKVFLTVGDWGWRLFGDEIPTPIMSSAPRLRQVTCGRWHTTRPGVIITGTSSGHIELWDLLNGGVHGPVDELQVADVPLRHCIPHANGSCIAVSDADGHVYLVSLPQSYSQSQPKERSLLVAALEQEITRERTLQAHIASLDTAAGVQVADPPTSYGFVDHEDTAAANDDLQRLTEQYLKLAMDDLPPDDPVLLVQKQSTVHSPNRRRSSFMSSPTGLAASDSETSAVSRRRSTTDFAATRQFDATAVFEAEIPPADEQHWVTPSARKPAAPAGKPQLRRF